MPLGPTFSVPVEQTFLDNRSSAARRLNKHHGVNTEVLDLVESAWSGGDGADEEVLLMEDPEKLVPAALQRLQRSEIVQVHFGYAPALVSLGDPAIVMRRSMLLSAWSLVTVALQMRYVSGIGKDSGLAEASAVGVSDDSKRLVTGGSRCRIGTNQLRRVLRKQRMPRSMLPRVCWVDVSSIPCQTSISMHARYALRSPDSVNNVDVSQGPLPLYSTVPQTHADARLDQTESSLYDRASGAEMDIVDENLSIHTKAWQDLQVELGADADAFNYARSLLSESGLRLGSPSPRSEVCI
ncbi:hypothetical protein EDB86DRAFT_2943613, partial [Lactarius hatsudake]